MTNEKNPNKGKEREEINIIASLDSVIKDNEKLSVNLASKSKADLSSKTSWNKLYHMKKWERDNLAKEFTGLDRILYDKLRAKIGSKQSHGGENFALGVVNSIPVVSVITGGIATTFTLNDAQIELENRFSIEEVKEIINELGIIAKNNKNNETLEGCKKKVIELEKKNEELREKLEVEDRELWGEKGKTSDLQKRLIKSLKRELSLIIRPLEIEKEGLDNLIRNYKKLYWAREKNDLRKIETKEKRIGEIEKKLENKVKNEDLEKELFGKCEEIAELKFQSKQARKLAERQLEKQPETTNDKARIEVPPPLKK